MPKKKKILRLALLGSLSLGTALVMPLASVYAADEKNENAASVYEANTRAELELKNKEAQIKQLKTVLDKKNGKLDALEGQVSAQELLLREKDILQAEISAMEKKMSVAQESLKNAKENIVFKERREEELNALLSQMEQMISDHEVLLRQNEKYEQIIKDKADVETQVKGLAEDKRRMAENMQILQDEYDSATKQLDVMKGEKMGSYEQEIAARDLEIADLRSQVKALVRQMQGIEEATPDSLLVPPPAPRPERMASSVAASEQARVQAPKQAATKHPYADWAPNEAAKMEQALKDESTPVKAAPSDALVEAQTKLLPLLEDVKNKPLAEPKEMTQSALSPASSSILSGADSDATMQRLDDLSFENQELHRQNEALKTFLTEMSETIRNVSTAPVVQENNLNPVSAHGPDIAGPVNGAGAIPIASAPPSALNTASISEAERMEMEMIGTASAALNNGAQDYSVPPKVFYKPSIPIPGVLQASEGYVPATFGVLAKASGPDKIVYQWHEGDLYSSAEQRPMGDREFDEFVRDYLLQTQERCQGDFAAVPADTRDVGDVRIDSYDIACIITEQGINAAASLLFFNKDETFTVISNETATTYVDQAMDKRDNIIHAIEGGSFL